MITIKFSHRYVKMPVQVETAPTRLLAMLDINADEISQAFRDYDTTYFEEVPNDGKSMPDIEAKQYTLPRDGDMMVLLLETSGQLWTTIRRYTHDKAVYYQREVGKEVKIEIIEK